MLQNTRANNCECFVGFVLLPPVQQVAPSPSPLSPSSFISFPSPSISLPLTSSSPSISFPLYLSPPSLSLPFHPSSPPFPSPSISLSLISIPSPPFPSPSTSIFPFPLHLSRKGVDDQLKFLRLRITGIPFIRNTHHTEYLWATKSESLLTPFIRDTCTHHNDMQWEPKSETPPNIYHQMYPPPNPPESECGTNLVAGPRSRSWWEAGTVLACSDPPCAAEPPPDPASDNGDNCSHYLVHSVRHSNCRTELSFHSSTSLSPLKHECETST